MATTHNLMSFVRDLRDPRARLVSPIKLAIELGLSLEELAVASGVEPGIIHEHDTGPIQERLQQMVAAIEAATAVTDSIPAAIEWFFNDPLFEGDDRTAQQYIADGEPHQVAAYIKTVAAAA